jgi:ATP-binding cassette subfamily A (ABC1) protein 3
VNITLAAGNTSLPTTSLDSSVFEFTPMPTYAHTDDTFATALSNLIGFLYCLAFISPVTKLVSTLVAEKETRIKEGMKMMGLSETAYFFSHFTTAVLQAIIMGVVATIVTSGVYKNSTKGYVFVYWWLYCMCIFCFCYLMSTFFSKARTACKFSTITITNSFLLSQH